MNDASHSQGRIAAATDRLLATVAEITDAQAREPSLLPGWTRGHVLTHLARNADGLRNLLTWARTGTETPMYPSAEAREAEIEAGAGRPAAELAADVTQSAVAFAAEAASMPDEAWAAEVRALYGPPFPAHKVLNRRLTEVVMHHSDLGVGYTPDDWPADFVSDALPGVADSFTHKQETPRCRLVSDGAEPREFLIGPEQAGEPTVIIHGRPGDLLAWLTGRADGARLTAASGGALPELPPW